MSRLVDSPIQPPVLDAGRRPLYFRWAGRRYRVATVIDSWEDIGAWWDRERPKRFWRVETREGEVFDLWQDAAGEWAVYRVWD